MPVSIEEWAGSVKGTGVKAFVKTIACLAMASIVGVVLEGKP